MQALQFLKGSGPLPAQKEVGDLSSRKESTVSSFKTMLEDASHREAPEKAGIASAKNSGEEVKTEAPVTQEGELSQVKKGKFTENESERHEIPVPMQDGLAVLMAGDGAMLYASSGEEVLFGQPVEHVTGTPVRMDIGVASLEDVTAIGKG